MTADCSEIESDQITQNILDTRIHNEVDYHRLGDVIREGIFPKLRSRVSLKPISYSGSYYFILMRIHECFLRNQNIRQRCSRCSISLADHAERLPVVTAYFCAASDSKKRFRSMVSACSSNRSPSTTSFVASCINFTNSSLGVISRMVPPKHPAHL